MHQTPEAEILRARAHVLSQRADELQATESSSSSSFAKWGKYAEEDEEDVGGSETSDDGAGRGRGRGSGTSSSSTEDDGDSLLQERRSGLNKRRGAPRWSRAEVLSKVSAMATPSSSAPLVLLLEGWAVDVSSYVEEHPGGVEVLREWAVGGPKGVVDADEGFEGLNDHGWSAREVMRGMRVARIVD